MHRTAFQTGVLESLLVRQRFREDGMSSVLKDSWQPQNKQNKPSPWDASGLQQHFLWVSSPVSGLCVPDQELSRGVNKSHAFPANSSPINIPRAMFWNGKMNWNIRIFINPNKPQAMLTGKVKHPKFLPAKHLDVSEVEKFPIQFFFFMPEHFFRCGLLQLVRIFLFLITNTQ